MENLKEITPDSFKCGVGMCPAVFECQDGVLIVGKKVEAVPKDVESKIGPDETVILVPLKLLQDLKL